ncbi:MAG: hypothetical protein HUJ26_22875 [Planctomycetaceae bacterium]|nr:hypothetical protein [Planctomycetaceae bacterium]
MKKILCVSILFLSALPVRAEDNEPNRPEVKLSNRSWTVLLLVPDGEMMEAIPDDAPIWNFERRYKFSGTAKGQHRLGKFSIDGEFVLKNGWLFRAFGDSALLGLPKAEDFELEGRAFIGGEAGGWLMLVGWDMESKSGYAIYATRLKTIDCQWYIVEIKDGKAVAGTEKMMVKRNAEGDGALRVMVDNKKLSLQASGVYLIRDVPMPNY